jgi:hypothetical protein
MPIKQLPTFHEDDEADLNRVKIGTYVFSAVVGVWTALTLFGLLSALGAAFAYDSGVFFLIASAAAVVSGGLYTYINYRSAKAIAQRQDPHLTYFVAGMNVMAFPLGTLLSWYTWKVLSRPSVQELYKQGVPALPPHVPSKKKNPKLVAPNEPVNIAWADTIENADDDEEKMWREMEQKANKKDADNGKSAQDGSIRLVAGED